MDSFKTYLKLAYPPNEAWTGPDKVMHASVGFFIASLFGIWLSPLIGLLLASGAGVGKEVYDYQNPGLHTPSLRDTIVTVLGGCGGAGAAVLVRSFTGL